jgi:nicotinate-nucleotide pyrophosphorylase (carboxylating)
MRIEPPPSEAVGAAVQFGLLEDRAAEDATTIPTVAEDLRGEATLLAKEAGVLAGLPIAEEVFRAFDLGIRLEALVNDGEAFQAGDVLARLDGRVRPLLQGERLALNFLQRLSGTATLTRQFVDAIAGTRAVILDTRKTTPGLRALEKYAVRCGGGTNHRADLASMAMIKDNHREALEREGRSLAEGVAEIRRGAPGIAVEIEIDALSDLEAALAAGPEWILLDNMELADMAEAVVWAGDRVKLEASGGVTLQTVRAIAETGVDAISVGALTHSARALDISLDLRF